MYLTRKPILLLGMMGAGKSTLGALLAEALDRDFFDCDVEIEKISHKTIPEIFRDQGEPSFRVIEAEVLGRLLDEKNAVIAAGGGILRSDKAITIWLKGEAGALFKRAQKGPRPKLEDFQSFTTLYQARTPEYAKADIHIDNGGNAPHKALAEILAALEPK